MIGSDTSAALDGKTLGKPHGLEDFMDFFPKLSGRVHTVVTAVALVSPGGEITERICSVDVEMAAFTADDALRYWRTGEPADKAAGYAVQGSARGSSENRREPHRSCRPSASRDRGASRRCRLL